MNTISLMKYDLSVIIPTKDRLQDLRLLVGDLQQQVTQFSFEILIIDNASSNPIQKSDLGLSKALDLSIIREENVGLHFARNIGVSKSNAERLLFLDDDVRLPTNTIQSVIVNFVETGSAMLAYNVLPSSLPSDLNVIWSEKLWLRDSVSSAIPPLSVVEYNLNDKSIVRPNKIWGCFFPVLKDVIEQCNGFNPDGFPSNLLYLRGDGETKITNYVESHGLKVTHVAQPSIEHKVTVSRAKPAYFFERGYAQGWSEIFSLNRNRNIFIALFMIWLKVLRYFILTYLKSEKKVVNHHRAFYSGLIKGMLVAEIRYLCSIEQRKWVQRDDYATE